jgi:hypothetical protein
MIKSSTINYKFDNDVSENNNNAIINPTEEFVKR